MIPADHRRHPRSEPDRAVTVHDALEGHELGRLGNISKHGLMIISARPIDEDLLMQLRMTLSDGTEERTVELAAESLWCSQANVPGRYWTGFEIVDIAPSDAAFLSTFASD